MEIRSRAIKANVYEATDGIDTIIYAPLKNLLAHKWRVLPFIQRNIIRVIQDKFPIPNNVLTPTVLELDMSHSCSLKCIYCSVNSNDSKDNDRSLKMNFPLAKKAIDLVMANSKKAEEPFTIVFIGKGEPTLNWRVLVQCVEYIKTQQKNLSLEGKTVIVTNGFISEKKATWLAKNISQIALSWDGDEESHNAQRPTVGNKDSYSTVERTASILKEAGAYFEIRATWTVLNIDQMAKITKRFIEYHPFGLNYQPLLLLGRGSSLKDSKPAADLFVDSFIESKLIAEERKIPVMMPSVDISRLNRKFCQAYEGTGLHLSANGSLTACECVFGDNDDSPGKLLTYGKMTEKETVIDEEKISLLKLLTVDSIERCANCFVRWHCAGGCLNTHLQTSDNPLGERKHLECYTARSIVWETLKMQMQPATLKK